MAQTSTHKIYYPTLTAIPNVPEDVQKCAESVDSALSNVANTKQNVPTNGTTMLTYANGQSANPVTVWATTQNTTNNPTNGQNLQFQWADTKPSGWVGSFPNGYRLRLHVDARGGQAGQTYHDVAWAFAERRVDYGGFGYSQSTNKAVMVSGLSGGQGNDIHLLWLNGYLRAQIDATWVGDLAYVAPSSARFKDVDENSPEAETLGAFVDAVPVVRFKYKNDPSIIGAAIRGREHVGFIAEDVRDLAKQHGLPADIVKYDSFGEPAALSEPDLIAVLWATVQDLRNRVAQLESSAYGTKEAVSSTDTDPANQD